MRIKKWVKNHKILSNLISEYDFGNNVILKMSRVLTTIRNFAEFS